MNQVVAEMDFNALRAKTLGSGTDEEAVTVNTRALIDKVLARYSGEWTVLRELLQNAADASATKIIIRFETLPSSTVPLPQDPSPTNLLKHTVRNHTIKRLVVTNNGQTFNENDWSRLKRIAEGNPDETKIGAFGVGFYSTFADCEEPFVSSGREAMAFFWKNNSLFTRRLRLPESEASTDTNFVLDYRDTSSPVPSLLLLAQFLASSLTFVGLENIELWLDQWNIMSLTKKTSPSLDVSIPRDIEPKTSEGFMKVTKVSREVAQIDGRWMAILGHKTSVTTQGRGDDRESGPSLRKFFSRLAGTQATDESQSETPLAREKKMEELDVKVSATIFLHVNTATIKTFTGQKFNEELERATKKPPPKYTKLAIMTAPFTANSGLADTKGAGDIFGTVLPSRGGRIFIGFATHQTTGLSAHISAPSVIPTVERESIDLNARYVRTWNIEMLRAAGIVCRIAWSSEMADLKATIQRAIGTRTKIRQEDVDPVLSEAVTTFQNFSFRESTPSSKTGEILEDAFWTCGKSASIDVLSSCGVLPTHQVRIAPKDLSFMQGVPILPDRLVTEADIFVKKLMEFGLVTEVTVSDIKRALELNPLASPQVSEFLSWLCKQSMNEELDRAAVQNLLAVAVTSSEEVNGSPRKILMLGQINHFVFPGQIPVDLPTPPTVLPQKFTKSLSKQQLESIGWQELQVLPWLRWLIAESGNRDVLSENQDMTKNLEFSTQMIHILSKKWDTLSQSSKGSLCELLENQTVIPTKLGLKRPGESYFPNVKLFDDLPTISGLKNVKDKFLVALGVRKTVELGVVFDRLLARDLKAMNSSALPQPQWSHINLIEYLASVRDDIPKSDIQRLKNTPICPRYSKEENSLDGVQKYKVSELFEPRQELRDLGLPVLAWQGPYRGNSPEGKFLSALGLRTIPTPLELTGIMAEAGAKGNLDLRDKCLIYFLSHHHAHNYGSHDYSTLTAPFLPVEGQNGRLVSPSQCYYDQSVAVLGFEVLQRDWIPHAEKFGIRQHPPIESCIGVLTKRPPATHAEARIVFSYFANRLGEINTTHSSKLRDVNFVPLFSNIKEKAIAKSYTTPRNCFLGDSDTYREIFDYVDFGQEANSFLSRCGSKQEPTNIEVAQILVREPARISASFKDAERYLRLLRNMADNISSLKREKDLFKQMKQAPFLLASKDLPTSTDQPAKAMINANDADEFEDEEAQGIREFHLCSAQSAVIIDDYINFNLFKTSVLAAPQEEALENFYSALGSPTLSSLVEEAARHGPRSNDQRPAQRLQKQILERSRLFLHDQPAENIKHDSRWLEKNLQVQLVSSISLRRSLKGMSVSHTAKRSAVVTQVNREYTLWITGEKPDFYQVSQALIHILLTRPKLHLALTLEMLLKTDLLELRARGFNVSRILRQKAVEARLAESRRQQELEEEQKRIAEQERAWTVERDQEVRERAQRERLPGGFPDSPENRDNITDQNVNTHPMDDKEPRKQSRNLFSNISRQFGLNNNRHLQSLLGGSQNQNVGAEAPPPYSYSEDEPNKQRKSVEQPVTAPHKLRENLLSAIKKTRSHNSQELFSRGETNTVSEKKTYCDEHPAHDLAFVAEIKHGIRMFLSPSSVSNSSSFLQKHSKGLTAFATLLKNVGQIFSLNPATLNIFYESTGKTIGFNKDGSIFCNYLHYHQLHQKDMDTEAESEGFVYWWVLLCHELAHNLVGDHSSEHSYYVEGFVSQYFGRVMKAIGQAQSSRANQQQDNKLDPLVEL